jgi:hypothetical protein
MNIGLPRQVAFIIFSYFYYLNSFPNNILDLSVPLNIKGSCSTNAQWPSINNEP